MGALTSRPRGELAGAGQSAPRAPKRADLLARSIVRDITRQHLAPGTMLPAEAEMTFKYAVGRATVREALRLLEAQGLIALKPGPGGGPEVAQLTPRHFGDMARLHLQMADATYEELVHARLSIEPLMAGLAATNRDPAGAERLQRALEETKSVDLEDDDAYMASSRTFHSTITGISGNRVLDLFSVALKEIMDSEVEPAYTAPEDRALVQKAHEDIAEAVLAGHAEKAEHLMRAHMKEFADTMEANQPGFMRRPIEWTWPK